MLIQTPINPYLQFTAPSGDPTIDRHRLRLLLQALTPLLTATGGKVTVFGTKLIVSYDADNGGDYTDSPTPATSDQMSDVGFVPTTSDQMSDVGFVPTTSDQMSDVGFVPTTSDQMSDVGFVPTTSDQMSDVGFVPTTSDQMSDTEIVLETCPTTSENSNGASEQPPEAV